MGKFILLCSFIVHLKIIYSKTEGGGRAGGIIRNINWPCGKYGTFPLVSFPTSPLPQSPSKPVTNSRIYVHWNITQISPPPLSHTYYSTVVYREINYTDLLKLCSAGNPNRTLRSVWPTPPPALCTIVNTALNSALYSTALHCTTLNWTTLHYTALHYIAHYNTLYQTVLHKPSVCWTTLFITLYQLQC